MKNYDILIIGSGIAGMSVGAELSRDRKVLLIEKEKELSYHSTGRSFAFFIESYGNKQIIDLTKISKHFFNKHHNIFLKKKGVMFIADLKQKELLNNFYKKHKSKINLELLNKNETIDKANCLKEDYVYNSVIDVNASEIDVNSLHEFYRKKFLSNGGQIINDFLIDEVDFKNKKWIINNEIKCDIVVNASGAWADEVANKFSIKPINLIPKKRTVFIFKPSNIEIDNSWPLIADIEEKFYFKDQSKKIYASPADETPTHPHDCYANELDIAIGIDRIQKATNFEFKSVDSHWAGLRNFVNDKSPVIGFDDEQKSFFWLVAQGGYGIQTAPALAEISRDIIIKNENKIDEFYDISINRLR